MAGRKRKARKATQDERVWQLFNEYAMPPSEIDRALGLEGVARGAIVEHWKREGRTKE